MILFIWHSGKCKIIDKKTNEWFLGADFRRKVDDKRVRTEPFQVIEMFYILTVILIT